MAARLGVDIDISDDWEKLKKKFTFFKYSGFFENAWNRWWATELTKWWKDVVSKEMDLQLLTAENRVILLNEKLQLNLRPAVKLPKCSSSNFWVVCRGTGKPIATIDGFRTFDGNHTYPWQEQNYVSIDAALERTNISVWKALSPIEKERLEQVQKFFTRERTR